MTSAGLTTGDPDVGAAAREVPAFARGPVFTIAVLVAAVLVATSARYAHGFDELYFLVAGRDHPAWGYFDQPPLVPLLAGTLDRLFPGSLIAFRAPMALAAAAGVVVTALISRELGGGRGAQAMAAGAYATSGLIVISHWMGTYVLDPLLWTVVVFLLVRWTRTRRDGLLVWAGVVTAVSLETKFLIPALWAAVALSALVLGPRRLLSRPKLRLGALIAVAATIPTLVWQWRHGWPYAHMADVVSAEFPGYFPFVRDGLLGAGLGIGLPALLYGGWRLVRSPELRPYRYLGVALALVALAVLLTHGRSYYLMSLFALPFAAAATELTRRNLVRWWKVPVWPAFALSAVVVVAGLPVWPASMKTTSFGPVPLGSGFAGGETAQKELAEGLGRTYAALPPRVREQTAVYSEIYPFAAADEYYGPRYGITDVYSGHRGYWYFDRPPDSARDVLFQGFDPNLLRPYFASVTEVSPGLMWLYSGRKQSWDRIWPAVKTQ
ncbi:glycosyltransferase family 39 protein [Amycolatopsis sp. PS_44_ISF1]|uniref:ArnT family glycosyltransferase n=1 Tax=Amycolatopsis sp. PS_44_ISF1 TaxID=2974917 RepID=UPI0028DE0DEA|nr:glycosyltransferase family 39 protein [Amycolatopsis sp. PS_44_ISF1]MDT8914787.1 glycosyltransferase family 39 protein [Amycolatopsis sp. PS_44_ISF1]